VFICQEGLEFQFIDHQFLPETCNLNMGAHFPQSLLQL